MLPRPATTGGEDDHFQRWRGTATHRAIAAFMSVHRNPLINNTLRHQGYNYE